MEQFLALSLGVCIGSVLLFCTNRIYRFIYREKFREYSLICSQLQWRRNFIEWGEYIKRNNIFAKYVVGKVDGLDFVARKHVFYGISLSFVCDYNDNIPVHKYDDFYKTISRAILDMDLEIKSNNKSDRIKLLYMLVEGEKSYESSK